LLNYQTLVNTGSIIGSGNFKQYDIGFPAPTVQTTLNNGTLSASSIQINDGTLAGNGVVGSPNLIALGANATVAPGDPAADPTDTLTFEGDVGIAGGLALEFASITDFDVISIFGDTQFELGSDVEFLFSFSPEAGDTFTFLTSDTLTGFDNINFEAFGLTQPFTVTDFNGDLTLQIVPVPAALPLFGSALAGFGLVGWRRRRRVST
jgi:hypothetical protein